LSGSDPIGATPFAGDTGETIEVASVAASVVSAAQRFYERMQASASRLLAKFATGTVVLRKQIRTETDDELSPYTVTETALPRNTVVTGYADRLIDGNMIRIGDRRVVMDAASLAAAPTTSDQLAIDSVIHAIIDVKPIPAAGVAAVYIVQARTAGAA